MERWQGMIQSPVTGEVGFGQSWIRLRPGYLGLDSPSLLIPSGEFPGSPARYGFEVAGERDAQVPVPQSQTLGLDISSRHDVDLYESVEQGGAWIAGAAFEDAHPDQWWDPIHQATAAIVFVGDSAPLLRDEPIKREWVASLWIAVLPLVVRAWESGVGTARPDQV